MRQVDRGGAEAKLLTQKERQEIKRFAQRAIRMGTMMSGCRMAAHAMNNAAPTWVSKINEII